MWLVGDFHDSCYSTKCRMLLLSVKKNRAYIMYYQVLRQTVKVRCVGVEDRLSENTNSSGVCKYFAVFQCTFLIN